MHGRTRRGAVALGTLITVPLASAEAAEAYPVDDSGQRVPTAPQPDPPAKPADPKPAVPRAPLPANPTVHVDEPVRRYADDRREPRPEPPPPSAVPEPKPANPTIYTGHPTRRVRSERPEATPKPVEPKPEPISDVEPGPVVEPTRDVQTTPDIEPTPEVERPIRSVPQGSHPTTRREPGPANPTVQVDPPSIGVQSRPPDLPRSADAADRWLRGGYVPEPVDDEPEPDLEETETGTDPEPEPEVEPEPEADPAELLRGAAKSMDDDPGIRFGVNVDLPGDRFDVGASTEIDIPDDPRETLADTVGPLTATTMNPVGGLLKLRDHVREQLPEEVRPFTLSPTELLALGGNKLADQIPEGPEEPTLDDGPGALVEGYMRNNLRDGIRTLTGLPEGLVQMPKDIHTDMSNASEDLFRGVHGLEPREGSERLPGETGLEHYTRNHPFTGGFGNMGVNMYDRYYPFVAARYGNYEPLREDMTDPETGEMRAPTLVRDYYRAPNSTLLEDLTIPSLFVPFAKVPVRVKPPVVKPPVVKPRVEPPRVEPDAPVLPRDRAPDRTPDAPPPEVIAPDAVPDRTAPPRTPAEKVREGNPKLADDEGTSRVVDELLENSSSGTRNNTPRPERTDPDTGATIPREFHPTRTGGSVSELRAYRVMEDIPEVESVRLLEHSSKGKSPDAVLTVKQADGTTVQKRFEMTTVTAGRGTSYTRAGVGRAARATVKAIREAIYRKTRTSNQFQAPLKGVPTGGVQGIHIRGPQPSVAQLQGIVHGMKARLQRASVEQVWFFLGDRSLVRFDVNTGTHTILKPERTPVPR